MEFKNKKLLVLLMVVATFLPYVTCCWYDTTSPYANLWSKNNELCGTDPQYPNGKIVGGEEVTDTRVWPWLGYMHTASGRNFCTVELISWQWATTAAHCTNGASASQLQVTFGRAIRDGNTDHTQATGVHRIIRHPNYSHINSDIAILQLKKKMVYTAYVRPVCMQHPDDAYDEILANCWVAGWGRPQTSGVPTNVLQEMKVNLISNADCEKAYANHFSPILSSHICAEGTKAGTGICQGDSGGPLMCKWGDNQWVLVGIASFRTSTGCGTGIPDGFIRVSSFSQWITDQVDSYGGPN